MPDADDFDVEYFRNLLQGNSPKKAPEQPAAPARPAAGKARAGGAKAGGGAKGRAGDRPKKGPQAAKARLTATCAAFLTLALVGCAGRSGSIRWDTGVQQVFNEAQVLPGHRYYTAGSDTSPDAVLALLEDRPLRGGLWREAAMTPELLARLVNRMRGTRTDGPFGGVVLDDAGAKIGVWYSLYAPPPVKLLDDGGVVINLPFGKTEHDPPPPPGRGR